MPRAGADAMHVAWLGAATWTGPDDGVEASCAAIDDAVTLVSLRASRDLAGLATGAFTKLSAGWRFDPAQSSAPEGHEQGDTADDRWKHQRQQHERSRPPRHVPGRVREQPRQRNAEDDGDDRRAGRRDQ